MRVYLDTSVYNRPFDDQGQPRIWLETMAFSILLQMIEDGVVDLISSSVLEYENSRNPFPNRRQWVERCIRLAVFRQVADHEVQQRAEELAVAGFAALDALHVACAEAAEADYCVTCDDRLLRRARGLTLPVLDPVDTIRRLTGGAG